MKNAEGVASERENEVAICYRDALCSIKEIPLQRITKSTAHRTLKMGIS